MRHCWQVDADDEAGVGEGAEVSLLVDEVDHGAVVDAFVEEGGDVADSFHFLVQNLWSGN